MSPEALMRNYQEQPLKYAEKPKKEDLEFLYIHENRTKKELVKYFNRNKDTVTTWLKYYNIEKPQELIKKSIEQVQLERYGTKYYMQSKYYQAKKEQICQKRAETNLKKYGTRTPGQNEEIKNKIKKTCLGDIDEKGLNIYQRARKKGIETCLKRYGVTTYSQTQECKEKTKQNFKSKYGVISFGKTENFKNLYRDKDWVKDVVRKIYTTKKTNKTFTISKQEQEVGVLLREKYQNVFAQYRSKLYPYNCDYYIPQEDLYIECHFHWTHGHNGKNVLGLFDKRNPQHIVLLKKWKEKNSKYYNGAIKTWTQIDPLKLETFEKNKLNYKIFYTLEEFKQWYKTV